MTTPEKRDRIFLLYGKSAFQAQLLEEELFQILVDQRWSGDTMPAKVIEDAEQGLGKLPLGPLGKKFREEFPGFTHFADYLDLFRKKRNYLAHFFSETAISKLSGVRLMSRSSVTLNRFSWS